MDGEFASVITSITDELSLGIVDRQLVMEIVQQLGRSTLGSQSDRYFRIIHYPTIAATVDVLCESLADKFRSDLALAARENLGIDDLSDMGHRVDIEHEGLAIRIVSSDHSLL